MGFCLEARLVLSLVSVRKERKPVADLDRMANWLDNGRSTQSRCEACGAHVSLDPEQLRRLEAFAEPVLCNEHSAEHWIDPEPAARGSVVSHW